MLFSRKGTGFNLFAIDSRNQALLARTYQSKEGKKKILAIELWFRSY